MKQIRMAAITLALVLGGLTSCTKDNSGTAAVDVTGGGDVGPIATTLRVGTWVAAYNNNGQSVDLTGYVFTFGDGNYLGAIYNGSVVYNGTWSADEVGDNISIDFGTTTLPLSAVAGSWKVIALTQSVASLRRTNGSAMLTFQKTVGGS